jgi:crossover junction endodeoxyribonuclease RusA
MKWEPAVTVRLPYPVSANAYWHSRVFTPKDGPHKDRQIVSTYPTHEATRYKRAVRQMLLAAGMRKPIEGRVRVDIQLHPHCPQDWRTRERKDPLWWADTVQRLDIDNANKVLLDALKGAAIVDDDQVWELTGKVMEPKADVQECVVLRISRGIKDNPQQALDLPEPKREVAFP